MSVHNQHHPDILWFRPRLTRRSREPLPLAQAQARRRIVRPVLIADAINIVRCGPSHASHFTPDRSPSPTTHSPFSSPHPGDPVPKSKKAIRGRSSLPFPGTPIFVPSPRPNSRAYTRGPIRRRVGLRWRLLAHPKWYIYHRTMAHATLSLGKTARGSSPCRRLIPAVRYAHDSAHVTGRWCWNIVTPYGRDPSAVAITLRNR